MRFRYVCGGWLALVALVAALPPALAQDGKRPDPADPRSPAPGMKFESAFSDYRPYREQPMRSWKEANQDVADNPGMGRMADMPGMNMPGMDSKPGAASKGGAAGQGMGAMPGMDSKAGAAPPKGSAAGQGMGAMPGMGSKAGAAPKGSAAGSEMGAMPGMGSKSDGQDKGSMKGMPGMDKAAAGAPAGRDARLAGSGVVRGVDKAGGKVKLSHDPIEAAGWPAMTLSFRLKDSSLADRVKEGDKVEFSLEKSGAGYVISALQKSAGNPEAKHSK